MVARHDALQRVQTPVISAKRLVAFEIAVHMRCLQDQEEVVGLCANGDVGVTWRQVRVLVRDEV